MMVCLYSGSLIERIEALKVLDLRFSHKSDEASYKSDLEDNLLRNCLKMYATVFVLSSLDLSRLSSLKIFW